jgi:hypothetical protein
MILTAPKRRALERALATVRNAEDGIAFLEQIASVSPIYAERVKQLRERQQYLIRLAETALVADSSTRPSG